MYTTNGQQPHRGESAGTQAVSQAQRQPARNGSPRGFMSDNGNEASAPEPIENPPISITLEDISAANQLSLACPICASPVEAYASQRPLAPIVCTDCGTLYHSACWEQNGGKCAVIGCDSKTYFPHGSDVGPTLTITHQDIMRTPARHRDNAKRYKERRPAPPGRSFWSTLFERIRRAFSNLG